MKNFLKMTSFFMTVSFVLLVGVTPAAADPDTSLSFDGSNDYVDVGSDPSLDFGTNDFTISAWIKTSISDDGEHMIYSAFTGSVDFYFEVYQKKLRYRLGGTNFQHSANIADGQWHHVVLVHDRNVGGTIYVDGVGESGGGAETSDLAFSNNVTIGRYSRFNGYQWDGNIGEVKTYTRAITSSEVVNLYNGTAVTNNIQSSWDLDEGMGSQVGDNAGSNDGTVNGPSWDGTLASAFPPDTSLSFDGSNDYVDVGSDPSLDFGTNDFTISAWIKTSISDDGEHMIYSAFTGSVDFYFEVYQKKLRYRLGGTNFQHSANIADGQWHHVVLVHDRNVGGTIYVDGVGESGGGAETSDLAFSNNVTIGRYSRFNGYQWDGNIAEVETYTRGISSNEVVELYKGNDVIADLHSSWDLDEGLGNNVEDSAGDNDGVVYGPSWAGTLASASTPGTSLSFDGSNDYVDVGSDPSLDFGTNDFTISAWIKTSISDDGEHMIYSAFTGSVDFYFEVYQKKLRYRLGGTNFQHSANIADGQWHHVVLVHDRNVGGTIYVDGVGESGGGAETSDLAFSNNVTIGRYSRFNGYQWDGNIGEVKTYTRTIDSADVLDLYEGTSVETGLQSSWKLDEGMGSQVGDSAGDNDGVVYGPSWAGTLASASPPDTSLSFDGSNDYVDVGSDPSLDFGTNDFTISAWIKTSISDDGEHMIYSAFTGSVDFYFEVYQKKLRYRLGGTNFQHSANIVDGQWHHVVIAHDRNVGGTLYVDGVGQTGGGAETSDLTFSNNVTIGRYSCFNGYQWDGNIGEVKTYTRAITGNEVVDLYKGSDIEWGLQSNWCLDEGMGSTIRDSKGSNDGTINGPSWAGTLASASPPDTLLSFDGSNDYVDLGSDPSLDFGTNDFTISAWIKTSVSDDGEHMIYSAFTGSVDFYFEIYQKKLRYRLGETNFQHSANIADGQWHHVVIAHDRNVGSTLYVDGVGQTGGGAETSDLTFSNNVTIGRYSRFNGYQWDGDIGKVQTYTRAISSAEVIDLYKGEDVTSGLQSSWHLDEGTGGTVGDNVGDNDGLIHGATWQDHSVTDQYEYYDPSGLIKRKIEGSTGNTYEYENADTYGNGSYGRSLLSSSHTTTQLGGIYTTSAWYKSYEWGDQVVEIGEYDGEYSVAIDADIQADEQDSEERVHYTYYHRGVYTTDPSAREANWDMAAKGIYNESGSASDANLIEAYMWYNSVGSGYYGNDAYLMKSYDGEYGTEWEPVGEGHKTITSSVYTTTRTGLVTGLYTVTDYYQTYLWDTEYTTVTVSAYDGTYAISSAYTTRTDVVDSEKRVEYFYDVNGQYTTLYHDEWVMLLKSVYSTNGSTVLEDTSFYEDGSGSTPGHVLRWIEHGIEGTEWLYDDNHTPLNTEDDTYLQVGYASYAGNGTKTLYGDYTTDTSYNSYDWYGEYSTQVAVTMYDGVYSTGLFDELGSGIDNDEKVVRYVYDHNGERSNFDANPESGTYNGWIMREQGIFTSVTWDTTSAQYSTVANNGGISIMPAGPTGDEVEKVTAVKKFGSASAAFYGTGGIAVADSYKWEVTPGDEFTIDLWINSPDVPTSNNQVLITSAGTYTTFSVEFDDDSFDVYMGGLSHSFGLGEGAISQDTWYHLALVCDDEGKVRAYLNGEHDPGDVWDVSSIEDTVHIGAFNIGAGTGNSPGFDFEGYIDDFRISNGARWTGDFTTEISGWTEASADEDTAFLLNMNGSEGATDFSSTTRDEIESYEYDEYGRLVESFVPFDDSYKYYEYFASGDYTNKYEYMEEYTVSTMSLDNAYYFYENADNRILYKIEEGTTGDAYEYYDRGQLEYASTWFMKTKWDNATGEIYGYDQDYALDPTLFWRQYDADYTSGAYEISHMQTFEAYDDSEEDHGYEWINNYEYSTVSGEWEYTGQSTSNVKFTGQDGGSKWGAYERNNTHVVVDQNTSTYYGVSGAYTATLEYQWHTSVNPQYIQIYFTGGSGAPGNYHFEYWNGSSWVAPTNWGYQYANDGNSGQTKDQLLGFALAAPVSTTKVRFVRAAGGDETGIGVAEFNVADQFTQVIGVDQMDRTGLIDDEKPSGIPAKPEATDSAPVSLDEEILVDADILLSDTVSTFLDKIETIKTENTGEGVLVGLLDTGIDAERSDINLIGGIDLAGYNRFDGSGDADPSDSIGHGTKTAEVIGATAEDAGILAVKVFDGQAKTTSTIVGNAIKYAVDMGAKVLAMPFTVGSVGSAVLEAVEYALDNGAILVAGAGNDGEEIKDDDLAALEGIITVGSIDNDGKLSAWSNYGEEADLYAPWDVIDNDAGTSFSAAFVAGFAALILEDKPEMTASEVLSELKEITKDLQKDAESKVSSKIEEEVMSKQAIMATKMSQFTGYGVEDEIKKLTDN